MLKNVDILKTLLTHQNAILPQTDPLFINAILPGIPHFLQRPLFLLLHIFRAAIFERPIPVKTMAEAQPTTVYAPRYNNVKLLHSAEDHDDAWGQFIDLDDEKGELVDRRAKFLSIRNLLTMD
jgi:hypothetical protein